MCGLAGAYTRQLSWDEKDHVKTLMWLASLRGRDSTGMMIAYRHKGLTKLATHKDVLPADAFLDHKTTKDCFNLNGAYLVGAHTRLATVGDVTKANSHPYGYGDIVGAHNGEVSRFRKEADSRKITDSAVLIERISKHGLVEALKEAGEESAYALQYVNLKERTLNFVRNSKRPLAFMFNKNESTLYWSSETCMLEFLAKRSDRRDFSDPTHVHPGFHISFELGSMEFHEEELALAPKTYSHGRLIEADKHDCRFKKAAASALVLLPDTENKVVAAALTQAQEWQKKRDAAQAKKQAKDLPNGTNYIYMGWKGRPMLIGDVVTYFKKGCVNCTTCGQFDEDKPVYWIAKDAFLCDECRDAEFVQSYVVDSKVYKGELCIRN